MAKPRRTSPRQAELLGGLVVRLLLAFRALGLLALLGLLLLLRIASGLASGGVASAGNRPGRREHHCETEEDHTNERHVGLLFWVDAAGQKSQSRVAGNAAHVPP